MTELIPLHFSSQIGGYEHKIVGIPNLGNYCFANSFLQTLYSSKTIRQQIIDFSDDLLPTNNEFRILFKNKSLHDNISQYIELKIDNIIRQDNSNANFLEIVIKFKETLNIDVESILGNIELIKHKSHFRIKSSQRALFRINNITRNINEEYTFTIEKINGHVWDGRIYLIYTDYFNTSEEINNEELARKLEWFSTGSIKKGDILEIMRFKYLKQLFLLLNSSQNRSVLDEGTIRNTIKGIVATIVNKYSNSGGVDQSDSGEILLKIGTVLEKIFPINNLLKVVDLKQYLIKKSSGQVVIKTKDKERDPDSPEVKNIVLNAYECPKSSCILKDIYPIYLNSREFEASVNTHANIDNLLIQNDDNWARILLDQSFKDDLGSDEELYSLKDQSQVQGPEPNQWGFYPMVYNHKCAFHSKSNLVDKQFYCANSIQIMTPLNIENIPNFLLFYNSRTNPDNTYNAKDIIYNLYENFFGKHYMLTGVTVHSGGGTGGGHYISKVRHNDSNFFYISDSTTQPIYSLDMLTNTNSWSLLVYEKINVLNQNIIKCNQ